MTVGALTASRYPHGRLHVVVITKEEEERAPHPAMEASTGELVRRLRETLPPYQQKRLSHVVMPGPGPQGAPAQLGAPPRDPARDPDRGDRPAPRLRGRERRRLDPGPGHLPLDRSARAAAGRGASPTRAFRSPSPTTTGCRFAGRSARSSSRPSSSACPSRACSTRSSVCASSRRLTAAAPRLAWLVRPAFELFFRRSQICLGHNQFVRLDLMQAVGGFPTLGATEDSTLGYELGRRGVLIQALPMVEVTDLPETSEGVIRQNARWYTGVLDDIPFLWRVWRSGAHRLQPGPARAPHRQQGGGVADRGRWSIRSPAGSAGTWPTTTRATASGSTWPPARPPSRCALTVWVGGIMTQALIEDLHPYLPRPVDLAPQEPEGEVPRHVPLPDLLAARHARGLARALGPGPHRPLRARQDRPRHRPTHPHPLPCGERAG